MFYEQLIHLCEENGIKPTPLAKELGFSAGNLKRWENGATVNSDILLTISKHFKVSIDYLLTGKEHKLSDIEMRCIDAFKNLSPEDQLLFIGKMEQRFEDYCPETKESG